VTDRNPSDRADLWRRAAMHYWVRQTCPCGARYGYERSYPHSTGCPVGQALNADTVDRTIATFDALQQGRADRAADRADREAPR
jgi:hypothetical protein